MRGAFVSAVSPSLSPLSGFVSPEVQRCYFENKKGLNVLGMGPALAQQQNVGNKAHKPGLVTELQPDDGGGEIEGPGVPAHHAWNRGLATRLAKVGGVGIPDVPKTPAESFSWGFSSKEQLRRKAGGASFPN